MIAVCPSCHDEIHHGKLGVTDEVLYSWKSLARSSGPDCAQIYVEPSKQLKLLTGTLTLSTKNEHAAVFDLSNSNKLKFRILDGDILQVTARLRSLDGKDVLRVVDNHVRIERDPELDFDFRHGRARVTAPASPDYIPTWVLQQMQAMDPSFASNGRVIAIELEVLKPGLVKVIGYWPAQNEAIVITRNALYICRRRDSLPIALAGEGEGSEIKYTGPINKAMFEFVR